MPRGGGGDHQGPAPPSWPTPPVPPHHHARGGGGGLGTCTMHTTHPRGSHSVDLKPKREVRPGVLRLGFRVACSRVLGAHGGGINNVGAPPPPYYLQWSWFVSRALHWGVVPPHMGRGVVGGKGGGVIIYPTRPCMHMPGVHCACGVLSRAWHTPPPPSPSPPPHLYPKP